MLVLSRKESQRIKLGDSIVVTVVRVSGDKVRLGIEAPSDVLILRDELEPYAENGASAAESTTLEGDMAHENAAGFGGV
jgi:carbon storage regulator